MSMLAKIQPEPTLNHYKETTDSFLLMLVKEMQNNPDFDKITLLYKAAENRIQTEQQTPFAKSITERIADNRNANKLWPESPEQAKSMLNACLEKYQELYPPLEMPVYAIVRNCQGLHDENYIYSREQMEKLDPDSLRICDLNGFAEGGFKGNDTYTVSVIEDPMQLRDFLLGSDNHLSSAPENDNYLELLEGFYWETRTDCMFTGEPNPTMEHAIRQFKLSAEDLSGNAINNELALGVGNGYVEIHRTLDDSYDFSVYDKTFNLVDGGLITDKSLSLVGVFRDLEQTYDFKAQYPVDIDPIWLAEKVEYNDNCRIELIRRGMENTLRKVSELAKAYPEFIAIAYTPSSININPASQSTNAMASVVVTGRDDAANLYFSEHVDSQYANTHIITKAVCSDIAEKIGDIGGFPVLSIGEQAVLSQLYNESFYQALDNGDGIVRDYGLSVEAQKIVDSIREDFEEMQEEIKPKQNQRIDAEIGH